MHPTSGMINRLRRWMRQTEAAVSVELIIVMPILLWALGATVVFYDGFRARYYAQAASQSVADLISRETTLLNGDYIEGLNGVFDFLNEGRSETRIRVSSVMWNPDTNLNELQWSYGTRSLLPLPNDIFSALETGTPEALLASFENLVGDVNALVDQGDAGDMGGFLGRLGSSLFNGLTEPVALTQVELAAMLPTPDLATRIPPVLPGETLLVVESFVPWEPFANVGAGRMRFDPVVVVRPRFAPWLNFEGAEVVYPPDNVEHTINDPFADGAAARIAPPRDLNVALVNATFETAADASAWSRTTMTSGGPTGGFLGPFGGETLADPLTFTFDRGTESGDVQIRFDLILLDTWDGYDPFWTMTGGDTMRLSLNGASITHDVFSTHNGGHYDRSRQGIVIVEGMTVHINMDLVRTGSSFVGDNTIDEIWSVSLTIQNAPQTVTLGFAASLDSDIANESFGIDNITVTRGPPTTPTTTLYQPGLLDYLTPDPVTGIMQRRGCAEPYLPAPLYSLTATDLDNKLEIERRAGGSTSLWECPASGGWGYANASADLVFSYTNDVPNSSLLITATDDNDGFTCDTVLLIRDPHGQWIFNDDVSGWNPGITITNAASGRYTVWLGTFGSIACDARLVLARG